MLRIGIIGSGFGVIGLLPAFDSILGCKVVAICAKKSEPLTRYSARTGMTRVYTDWKLLLESEDLDAIALAVVPNAQYEIAKVAISKGLHVFAEKPLAANITEARELLALAKKKKITHAIDFLFPEIPEWKKVKTLLDDETYGKLTHVAVNWDWLSGNIKHHQANWKTSRKEGGGALSFYFSHGLYYLEHFAGKIKEHKSVMTYTPLSRDGEAGVDMVLRFATGVVGNVHVSSHSPGLTRHQLKFQCERGVIVLENTNAIVDNFVIKIYSQSGIKQLSVKKGKGIKGDDERVRIIRVVAKRFVEACRKGTQMSPSFVDAVRVHELIEKIHAEAHLTKKSKKNK